LLLGAREAGFFPGIIFYLTLWPAVYRARVISFFTLAIPISSASQLCKKVGADEMAAPR
jgi:MFS transporter, ACS family, tartrate transporter